MTSARQITIPADQIYCDGDTLFFSYSIINQKDGRKVTCRDIYVNLSKAVRPELDMLAREVGLDEYKKMKKQELALHLNHWIKFEIPESLKPIYEKATASILDAYYDVEQTYIPVTQQTTDTPVLKTKFWFADKPDTKYNIIMSSLNIKELRSICKHLGYPGYSKWQRHELVELLEDKLVFEEQGS